MSVQSNNKELTSTNQENQVGQPEHKHSQYDSGWRQEADGSQWREKGETEYKKTESNTDGGASTTETYLYFNHSSTSLISSPPLRCHLVSHPPFHSIISHSFISSLIHKDTHPANPLCGPVVIPSDGCNCCIYCIPIVFLLYRVNTYILYTR